MKKRDMKKVLILISVLFSSFLLTSCSGTTVDDLADTTAPTAPSNLTATASSEAIYLSWTG